MWIVAGIAVLVISLRQGCAYQRVSSWPTVSGEIINIRKYEKTSTSTDGGDETDYYLSVTYRYIVEGIPYRSDNASIYGDISFRNSSYRNRFYNEIKKQMTVYYNPLDHSEAFIELPDIGGAIGGLLMGLAFFALGSFLSLASLDDKQKRV